MDYNTMDFNKIRRINFDIVKNISLRFDRGILADNEWKLQK